MSDRHQLDQIIVERPLSQAELGRLGDEIAASARPTVVVFIDLTDSTLMKYDQPVGEWIGFVYEFIKRCDFLARQLGGTVVKHIGDEAMITFSDVHDSEAFLLCMLSDETLRRYRYKAAVDYGDAFYLHSHHADTMPACYCPWPAPQDPYGKVVDRCARIAALAPSGSILCSEDYRAVLPSAVDVALAGVRTLKGIPEPCNIFYRHVPAFSADVCLMHPHEAHPGFASGS